MLQKLDDELVILTNHKLRLYELDLLVYSRSLDKLVAIEVSGNNYANKDHSLVGKKLLKDRLLKASGIDVKYFNVTNDDFYQNHFSLSLTKKRSRISIAEAIFDLVEDSFKHKFPRVDLSSKKLFT